MWQQANSTAGLRRLTCLAVALCWTTAAAAAPQAARQPSLDLAFDAARGRLTARVTGAELRDVLAALADATGAEVIGSRAIGERTVSLTLHDVPLERALERILAGSSYLLVFRTGRAGGLARVVLAAGGDARLQPQRRGSTAVPAASATPGALGADDGARRIAAIGLLATSGDVDLAREELRETLAVDPDEDVRRSALDALEQLGPVPRDVLVATAVSDASAALRLDALTRLRRDGAADTDAVAALVRLADGDPSPEVRAIASDVLRQWDGFGDE
ncbi:MAG: hypothetical protein AB1689_03725 [Thermodesulfobacteriota bacterium]